MAEAMPWQIALALQDAFEAIAADGGTSYWFTPDAVIVGEIADDPFDGAAGVSCFYVVEPRTETVTEKTSGMLDGRVEFLVGCAARSGSPTEDMWKDSGLTVMRDKMRLARDAKRALFADVQLRGQGLLGVINIADSEVSVDYTIGVSSWAFITLSFTVTYSTPSTAP